MRLEAVTVFDGVRWPDGPRDVTVSPDGRIKSVEPSRASGGGVLLPGFVDAHVHLAFADPHDVARGGVTTVLDLGSPIEYATAPHEPLRFRFAGPLITAPGGYPTESWGSDGYGLEAGTPDDARRAVTRLLECGACMIKVAIAPDRGPALDQRTLKATVDTAHEAGPLVAAHALTVEAVEMAVQAGVDVLAHTPVEPLTEELIARCARMWVVSTVRAFGDSAVTRRNLAALTEAGCAVAYGTDLGNDGIAPGIDTAELSRVAEALGGDDAALVAATSAAGSLAGAGGTITAGAPADLVWLPSYDGLESLAGPKRVWIGGTEVA